MKPGRKKDTFNVCIPCKRHKVKCDRLRPACGRCRRLNKICQYNNFLPSLPSDDLNIDNNYSKVSETLLSTPFSLNENGNFTNLDILAIEPNLSTENTTNNTPNNNSIKNIDVSDNQKYNLENLLQLPDVILDLWNPSHMMVTCGSTNHLDAPYTLHALIQYDPFTRLLCSSLHGTILYDLQNRIDLLSLTSNKPAKKTCINENFLGPLPFIERAMLQWVEKLNDYGQKKLIIDFFNITYTVEDSLHPNLLNLLQMILNEILIILPDWKIIDQLLKRYYENVYPFYPFIEIELFEQRLREILTTKNNDDTNLNSSNGKNNNSSNLFEFNILNKNIRFKLETLILFITIISISSREYSISQDTICEDEFSFAKLDATNMSEQLIMQAKRILSLLDGSRYLNENIICCSLHLFLFDYLNPTSKTVHASHDEALSLKIIYQMAITMGLQHDPTKFKRFEKSSFFDTRIIMLKRKIWVGIQSLLLQICTLDGSLIPGNINNMIKFCFDENDSGSSGPVMVNFHNKFNTSRDEIFDVALFEIQEDIYKLQLNSNKLMDSLVMANSQSVHNTIKDLQNLADFVELKFPLKNNTNTDKYSQKNNHPTSKPEWRNAHLNLNQIKNLHKLNLNLICSSEILSVYISLMVYFESKTLEDFTQNHRYYSYFFNASVEWYMKLYETLVQILDGSFGKCISPSQFFSVNKTIIFTMVKLWRTQMSFILRLDYKNELLKAGNHSPRERHTISETLAIFRSHLTTTLQLFSKILQNDYFGAYQSIQMCKYLQYLTREDKLPEFINNFWNELKYGNDIPERIIEKINSKWGQGPFDVDMIKEYVFSNEILRNVDIELVKDLKKIIHKKGNEKNQDSDGTNTVSRIDMVDDTLAYVALDQLLNSNLELFINAM